MFKLGELKVKRVGAVYPGDIVDPPYILTESLDTDKYNDITSVENIATIGKTYADYCKRRSILKDMMMGSPNPFDSLSDVGKKIIQKYCASDTTTLITDYIMQGLSQEQAQVKYIENRVIDVEFAGACYIKRINSLNFKVAFLMFTDEQQAQTFNLAIKNFYYQLEHLAVLGIGYGDAIDGILNYIASNGSYTYGGLSTYTMNASVIAAYGSQEAALAALVEKLTNIILNGE